MAQRKPPPSARGKGSSGSSRPGGRPGSSPSGRTGATKAGPAQRPPARRKKSIVNQRRTPWGLIAVIGGIVVLAAVIAVAVVVSAGGSKHSPQASGDQIIPTTPTGATTKQATVKRVANTSGISGVLAFDTEGWPGNGQSHPGALQHDHVTGPVVYSVLPPVGGPHNAEWMNAGVYTKPIPNERAVHNLEHGAVWITYDPKLPKAQVQKLRDFVGKQSMISESSAAEEGVSGQANRYMDLSPWASNTLPSPIVMSAWGYQLRLTSPTDPRMQQFVDKFRHNPKYTPEYGSAVDGIPVGIGGRPAYDGSKKPNPSGDGT